MINCCQHVVAPSVVDMPVGGGIMAGAPFAKTRRTQEPKGNIRGHHLTLRSILNAQFFSVALKEKKEKKQH